MPPLAAVRRLVLERDLKDLDTTTERLFHSHVQRGGEADHVDGDGEVRRVELPDGGLTLFEETLPRAAHRGGDRAPPRRFSLEVVGPWRSKAMR